MQKFEQICAEQMSLCDALEDIADSLPDGVDRQKSREVSRVILSLLDRAHTFEETELFPVLVEKENRANASQALDRLRFEHVQDRYFAEEIAEALSDYSAGEKSLSPDALGYLLRGFFVSLRRHINVEKEMVALVAGSDHRSAANLH